MPRGRKPNVIVDDPPMEDAEPDVFADPKCEKCGEDVANRQRTFEMDTGIYFFHKDCIIKTPKELKAFVLKHTPVTKRHRGPNKVRQADA